MSTPRARPRARAAFVAALAALAACGGYERDIAKGSAAIASAATDAGRAAGYALRGDGYSEKARYLRAFKRIARPDYDALFALAVADFDRAAQLAPSNPRVFLQRGTAYYFRAYPGPPDHWESSAQAEHWLAPAEADFGRAVELDPRLAQAWDMRGLSRENRRDLDGAIADYERVMALDEHLGRLRLAEAHCERAGARSAAKAFDAAISDYEESVSLAAETDGCECGPYEPLAGLYLDVRRDADKSWAVVRAAKGKGYVSPEFIARLKQVSGRER